MRRKLHPCERNNGTTVRDLMSQVSREKSVNIIAPPKPDTKGALTFAVLKLHTMTDDPESPVIEITFDIIACHAQHFLGHVFRMDRNEVRSVLYREQRVSRVLGGDAERGPCLIWRYH